MPEYTEEDFDLETPHGRPEYTPDDAEVENPLRPKRLSDYIGQEKVKENMSVYIRAALKRQEDARPRAALWAAGARQDDARGHYCE